MRGPGEVFPTTVEVTADVPVPLHGRVIAGRSVAQPALHVRREPGGGGFFILIIAMWLNLFFLLTVVNIFVILHKLSLYFSFFGIFCNCSML